MLRLHRRSHSRSHTRLRVAQSLWVYLELVRSHSGQLLKGVEWGLPEIHLSLSALDSFRHRREAESAVQWAPEAPALAAFGLSNATPPHRALPSAPAPLLLMQTQLRCQAGNGSGENKDVFDKTGSPGYLYKCWFGAPDITRVSHCLEADLETCIFLPI